MRAAATLAIAFALLGLPARAADRSVLVHNAGNEAIFTLRIGHGADGRWSADLLGFGRVVDVSRGNEIVVDVDPGICTYDLIATYGDGHTQVRSADLCSVDRVRFDH